MPLQYLGRFHSIIRHACMEEGRKVACHTYKRAVRPGSSQQEHHVCEYCKLVNLLCAQVSIARADGLVPPAEPRRILNLPLTSCHAAACVSSIPLLASYCLGLLWMLSSARNSKFWPLITVSNKTSLQNQLQNPVLVTLKNLMRPLTARLEAGYCSITVVNHRLITVIRFVAKSYTHP